MSFLRNLHLYNTTLPPEWVSKHKAEIKNFFIDYDISLKKNYIQLQKTLPIHLKNLKIDITGSLKFKYSELNQEDKILFSKINSSYFSKPFFLKSHDGCYLSRGKPYYFYTKNVDEINNWVSFFNYFDITLNNLLILNLNFQKFSYITWSLLDDLRYKLIILTEYVLDTKIIELVHKVENLLNQVINLFYSYLNISHISTAELFDIINRIKHFNEVFLDNYDFNNNLKFRQYKEADNPLETYLFTKKLSNLNIIPDYLIGIRFGGIELPFVIKNLLFNSAKVLLITASNYSLEKTEDIIFGVEKNKEFLILDDNILTGRTLNKILTSLNITEPKNIYFGCVSYSGFKRYYQMKMSNHGMINPSLLQNICVLREGDFTYINSTKSYKNKNGTFDKIKTKISNRIK